MVRAVWGCLLRRAALALGMLGSPGAAEAMDYLNVTVQPDRAVPAACFSFSAPLPRGKADALEPFFAITPPTDHNLQPRGKDLCVTGLRHGARYSVRLKAGLPAGDGSTLPKDVAVDLAVPDREARVSFDRGRTLLPYAKGVGLPLHSVNVTKAHVTVYRFGERGLADQTGSDWYGQGLTGYTLAQVADRSTKLFEGAVDIASKPNAEVSTALAVDALVKALTPGVYVAMASPDDAKPDDADERATQWFSVSDIGLVTVQTDGGMLVSARSLETALPLADVTLRAIARSNEVLWSATTAADGRASVPAGLMRGEGGDTVRLLTATTARGDFTVLNIEDPALDLSDLDLKGRTPPGALDAFLWTDRGIYRPGETIHLGTLLRDGHAHLVPRTPLTLHLVRPDGIEVDHVAANLDRAGGGTLDIPVPDNAYSGEWTIWAGVAGSQHLGSTTVSVQDFVPPRLEAKLALAADRPAIGAALEATVDADYFYGSPGAALTGQVEASIQTADHPFAGLDDYRFGLEQEPFLPKALEAQTLTTDDHGHASVTFPPGEVPDTNSPLEVVLRATVNDVDGRPATADLTKSLRSGDRFIGLRTAGAIAENSDAGFDLVLVDGEGKPIGATPLQWDLVLEDYTYNSFFRDGRWQSEEIVTDARMDGGVVSVGADGRAHLAAHVASGRFRLEVYTADGKAASSLRFGAGWWGGPVAGNRKPDVLPVTVDASAPAGSVRARIEAPFAGRVLAMLDGDGLHQVQELEVPKGGTTVTFDAADVPLAGAYVLAVAISPAGAVVPRLPVRAVGAAWVAGSAAEHTLTVSLAAPDTIQPKTALAVDVQAAGAPRDEPVYVTVAAVDEAVLRMTDFATPDPAEDFVGRRAPGLTWRDVYGSLIDPDGQPGRLTEGGDARASKQMGGLDVKTFKTVALFSGPVMLDAAGHGTVSIDVPDFSGKLRLMAVAWTVDRFGHADRFVAVRPPLLAELTLPRFLAPGDKATARVMLTDLAAPEQSYRVNLTTEGPIALDRDATTFQDVKRDKRRYVDRTLTATGALGAGHIHMTVTGDDGTVATRDFAIGVRSPNAVVTTRQIRTLDPAASLTAGDALGQDMLPGTATLDVEVSTLPAFDVPGLLGALRRYPYGCAEQTVSRAFPELFATALGGVAADAVGDTVTGQGAIQRLYSLQGTDGSFGYWTPFDTGNAWLTAYVVDFLQHAEKRGLSVPESMKARALTWLGGRFASAGTKPADIAGNAYAAVVLARAGRLDLSQLRYVASRDDQNLPSEIARVQMVAALTHVGERDLAAALMRQPPVKRDPTVWLNDYGSDLRDRAMALSLASEEKLLPDSTLIARAADLSQAATGPGYLSTQDQVWLVRDAFDLAVKTPLDIVLDGKPVTGRTRVGASLPLGQGRAIGISNKGSERVYLSLATTGVPAGAQAAEANGFAIARSLFTVAGTPVNLADLHQNDEVVVVVEGSMDSEVQRKVLLVDMLPAGLEPESVGLSTSSDASALPWLKDVTEPTFKAVRDDRYLAGLDLDGGNTGFKLAYMVRAVTPGTYAQPGPQIEDMYAPAYHARGPAGTLEVKPARKP